MEIWDNTRSMKIQRTNKEDYEIETLRKTVRSLQMENLKLTKELEGVKASEESARRDIKSLLYVANNNGQEDLQNRILFLNKKVDNLISENSALERKIRIEQDLRSTVTVEKFSLKRKYQELQEKVEKLEEDKKLLKEAYLSFFPDNNLDAQSKEVILYNENDLVPEN
jgi:chromosome segregation ATPase